MNEPTLSEDLTRGLAAWIEQHGGDPDSAPEVLAVLARTIATAREHPHIDADLLAQRGASEALMLATPTN